MALVNWQDLSFEVIDGPTLPALANVALDQVLCERTGSGDRGPTLRFWRWDDPVIVMGSYQSVQNEVNEDTALDAGFKVTRRISGGGTMFMNPEHCITYSLIVPTALVAGMSFRESYEFLDRWVMQALADLGIKARYVPINDIASDNGKIAGAAQRRMVTGVTLHHVTMAYDIDSDLMHRCMRIGAEAISKRGVRSAVKHVDPLRSQTDLPRNAIINAFKEKFINLYNAKVGHLTEGEVVSALSLAHSRFADPEWVHRVP